MNNKKAGSTNYLGSSLVEKPANTKCVIKETPGTLGVRYNRGPSAASLSNLRKGFDGMVINGQQAMRRAQKKIEDLEALGFRPRYLVTLTLPHKMEAGEWCAAKDAFREKFAKLLNKKRRGCFWWQGFQKNGRPHLHILTDLDLEWAELLEWVSQAWTSVLGSEIPTNSVDVKIRVNFSYARGNHAIEQAKAPTLDRWGKWQGFMGSWNAACKQVRETWLETTLDAQEGAQLVDEMRDFSRRSALPDWLKKIVEGFTRGVYSAIWFAKRLVKPLESAMRRFLGHKSDSD